MELRPISICAAKAVVSEWHRHLEAPEGGKFALSAWHDGRLVGVAIVGRPPARWSDDGVTAEVTRIATDGTPHACSFLLGRAKRAAQALGFRRVLTKTLVHESGASLRAVKAVYRGEYLGGQWNRAQRNRARKAIYEAPKMRWEL